MSNPIGTAFVGDIGIAITLTIKDASGTAIDVSTATTKQIVLSAPGTADASGTAKTASFVTDGSDGQITYSTVSGDLSAAGTWRAQASIVLASGAAFRSSIVSFGVKAKL